MFIECTEEDITYTVSDCDPVTKTHTKTYSWITPSACIVGSTPLPDEEVTSCEVPTSCSPGMHMSMGKCELCRDDEMSETGDGCEPCPSGRNPALRARYFNVWDSIPDGFSTQCQGQCSTNGWRPAHSFIDSGSSLGIGSSSLSYAFSVRLIPVLCFCYAFLHSFYCY